MNIQLCLPFYMKPPDLVHIFLETNFLLIIPLSYGKGRALLIGGSFNGRTTDSDSVNRGSNPRLPAIRKKKGFTDFWSIPFFLYPVISESCRCEISSLPSIRADRLLFKKSWQEDACSENHHLSSSTCNSASVWRRRLAIASASRAKTWTPKTGSAWLWALKLDRESAYRSVGTFASTVAERMLPSRNESSPKKSPWPIVAR